MAWSFVGDGLSRLVVVLTSLYLARKLSAESFGLFALGQAVGQYAAIVMDLAANSSYAVREIAQNNPECATLVGRFLALRLITALGLVATAALVTTTAALAGARLPAAIVVSTLFAPAFALFPDWAFRGLERMRILAIGYGVMAISFCGLVLAFVGSSDDPVPALLSWLASYALGGAVLVALLRVRCGVHFPLWVPTKRDFGGWRSSAQFTIAGVLGISLSQGALLLVGVFSGPASAGLFGAPLRIVLAISTIGVVATNAVYPILASLAGQRASLLKASSCLAKWMLLAGTPLAVIGSVWADEIVRLVLGIKYTNAGRVLGILVWSIPASFVVYALEYALLSLGKERRRLIGDVAAAAVLAVIGVPLVAFFGEVGAAIAYSLSIGALLVAFSVGLHGLRLPPRSWLIGAAKSAMLVGGSCAATLFLRHMLVAPYSMVAAAVVYLAAVAIAFSPSRHGISALLTATSRTSRESPGR